MHSSGKLVMNAGFGEGKMSGSVSMFQGKHGEGLSIESGRIGQDSKMFEGIEIKDVTPEGVSKIGNSSGHWKDSFGNYIRNLPVLTPTLFRFIPNHF